MSRNRLFFPVAVFAVLAVAACGDAPDDAVRVEENIDGSSTMQIEVPEALTPAAEAIANPDQTLENLRQGAANMTDDAKVQAVQGARAAAEETARLLGRSETEIRQAGDDAERSAREALGMP